MTEAKTQIADLKATQSPRNAMATLQAFDTATMVVQDAGARGDLAAQVHPTKEFRDAGQTCQQETSALLTDISLDKDLYGVLASLDGSKLDAAGTYYWKTTLRDYRLAGVDRDDATRARIKSLQDEVVKVGQEFEENIPADVHKIQVMPADLDGLPEDFKQSHKPDASGKITLTTDNTDYFPFMQYSNSNAARKAFQFEYATRAPKNLEVLSRLMEKRYELAQTLGFDNWADYVTANKMVENEKNAAAFIAKISAASEPGMKRDYAAVLAYKQKQDPVPRWSIPGTTPTCSTWPKSTSTSLTRRRCVPTSNTRAF